MPRSSTSLFQTVRLPIRPVLNLGELHGCIEEVEEILEVVQQEVVEVREVVEEEGSEEGSSTQGREEEQRQEERQAGCEESAGEEGCRSQGREEGAGSQSRREEAGQESGREESRSGPQGCCGSRQKGCQARGPQACKEERDQPRRRAGARVGQPGPEPCVEARP